MNLNEQIFTQLKKYKISNLVEIGSRDGHDAYFLQQKFNILDENIFLFEPNKPQYEKISQNYSQYNNYEYCISEINGFLDFISIKDKIGISSLLERRDNLNYEYNIIKVKSITGDYLLKNIIANIDICKIDVEGKGVDVLESFKTLKNIKFIIIELEHKEVWKNQKLYKDAEIILRKTHKKLWTSYKNGERQSNSIWIKTDI